jgi:pSer/pThr/pTyr-binding forkhead associated (FHA) protein
MQAGCPHCGHVQAVSEEAFGGREVTKAICTSCGKAFQVFNPRLGNLKSDTTRHAVKSITSEVTDDGRTLHLPQGKTVSIRVLEGEDKGTVYPVLRPRVTLGRSNSDIIVNDPLSSRIHCALEFTDEGVLLRDLGSTNGTLVDNHPIHLAEIADGSTFQIGKHIFQLQIASEGT